MKNWTVGTSIVCDHWSHNYAFTSTAAFVSWSSWVLYFESQIKRTVQQNIRQTDVHINRHIYNYYYTLRCINRYALLTYLLLHSFRSWEFSLEWVLYWAIVCGYFWDPSLQFWPRGETKYLSETISGPDVRSEIFFLNILHKTFFNLFIHLQRFFLNFPGVFSWKTATWKLFEFLSFWITRAAKLISEKVQLLSFFSSSCTVLITEAF